MPRNIKILHVLHTFMAGGLENGVVNIINRSPDHLSHELCFLHRGGEFLQRLNRPVVYHELHKQPGNDPRLILRLRELFRRREVDIVHTRNWAAFDGILAACLMSKPTVIHGEHGRDAEDPAGVNKRRNLARRATAFRTKKLVAVSRDLHDWLKLTVRVPEKKLVLIPNGVDTDRFRPGQNRALRKAWGIADDEFVVGAIGRLDPIKNHEGVLNALASLNAGGRKARLVIVGNGPNRSKIEGLLQNAPSPRPLLLESRGDVECVYPALDMFVLNSFGEGMSNTLLEAMACGLPVVCTAVGGNVELVADGQRGTVIAPGDDAALAAAIIGYMSSPERRRAHGANAREFVAQQFSLEQMVRRYVALYESAA